MNRLALHRQPGALARVALSGLCVLGGCANLNGNVQGSFACSAPDGLCAPSSIIDDRALAMISGDALQSDAAQSNAQTRAGRTARQVRRLSHAQAVDAAGNDPARTRETVLRIVFQPYIDEQGRLHEASAVHAVVASADWQQGAIAQSPAPGRFSPVLPYSFEAFADTLDHADANDGQPVIDPSLPDPAKVAAARARASGPAAMKDVDMAGDRPPRAPAGQVTPGDNPVTGAQGATPRPATEAQTSALRKAASFPAGVSKDN